MGTKPDSLHVFRTHLAACLWGVDLHAATSQQDCCIAAPTRDMQPACLHAFIEEPSYTQHTSCVITCTCSCFTAAHAPQEEAMVGKAPTSQA